ncbi:hypothetical protein BRC81_07775 [Halobacteriales archaeon QS_1_68_20]|nr:MAG: hypothetical protein BRC81_07775 [Halobacteriales archaeon QS_1_68_20]
MLDPEREAASLVGRNPGLLVGGGLVTILGVMAYGLAWCVVQGTSLPEWAALLLVVAVGGAVRVVLLPFPLAGLYAAARRAREDPDGTATTLAVLGGAVRNYRRLFGATVVARLVTAALAVPLFGLLLTGDTLLTAAQYARGGDPLGVFLGNRGSVVLVVLLAGALARLAVAFYDLPVLFAGVARSRGWRTGLRFTRRRPRALARYGAGRALLWSPVVLGPLAADRVLRRMKTATTEPVEVLAVLGVIWLGVVAVVAALTLVAVHHVVVYGRAVEPFLREPTPTGSGTSRATSPVASPGGREADSDGGRSRRRVAVTGLAALLVTATVVSGAAVRIADVRPMPGDDVRPVTESMDAGTIVENARLATATTSHRGVVRTYEVDEMTGERSRSQSMTYLLDREDRQYVGRGTNSDTYASDSTAASNFDGIVLPFHDEFDALGTERNRWTVAPTPGYAEIVPLVFEQPSLVVPPGDDWRIVDRSDGRVVVGYEASERPGVDPNGTYVRQRARVHVDADTGRPTKSVKRLSHVTYAENGTVTEHEAEVTVVEFTDYGETDAERPDELGDRSLLE